MIHLMNSVVVSDINESAAHETVKMLKDEYPSCPAVAIATDVSKEAQCQKVIGVAVSSTIPVLL